MHCSASILPGRRQRLLWQWHPYPALENLPTVKRKQSLPSVHRETAEKRRTALGEHWEWRGFVQQGPGWDGRAACGTTVQSSGTSSDSPHSAQTSWHSLRGRASLVCWMRPSPFLPLQGFTLTLTSTLGTQFAPGRPKSICVIGRHQSLCSSLLNWTPSHREAIIGLLCWHIPRLLSPTQSWACEGG